MTSFEPRVRRARVPALAKINLDLRVLGKRADGYHELRTIFQTISLADMLEVRFLPGRRTKIELLDPQDIPGNLVLKAAETAIEAMAARGHVFIYLRKRIPMGAGLGGGSSDAAAVLLALNALTGRSLPLDRLCDLGAALGSDVPFFCREERPSASGAERRSFRCRIVRHNLVCSLRPMCRFRQPRLTRRSVPV